MDNKLVISFSLAPSNTGVAKGIPSFAPELLQNCLCLAPMKTKHLEKALFQFAEEGAAKIFKPTYGSGYIVGVVGQLQFEVLETRIKQEYGLPVRFEASQFKSACWISGEKQEIDRLNSCLLYTSPSPRDGLLSRMPSSA